MTGKIQPAERLVFEDGETLARAGADWVCALALAAVGEFAICLSGGSTPRRLYELLAASPIAARFPWDRVHWFWGDERFVPHDSPESNYRMVREAMLAHAPIPPAHIHAIATGSAAESLSPEAAADTYEATLKGFHGSGQLTPDSPLFDLTLLGIGTDGHTASLFPGHPELAEDRRWVVPAIGPDGLRRISLTYPALNSSRQVAFLAVGEEKRDSVARAQAGDESLPAARIHPVGRLTWFMDRAAEPNP